MKIASQTKSTIILIIFMLLSIVAEQFPEGRIALYPFTILSTWFHEMGHGLCALILGGNFLSLELFPDGSGVATHSGSLFFGNIGSGLVALAGPIGAPILGAVILLSSRKANRSKLFLFLFSIALALSVIIWVKSLFGILMISGLAVLFFIIALYAKASFAQKLTQFIGATAFASVYLDLGYFFSQGGIINGQEYVSDTGAMEKYLFLPYWFWGGLVVAVSLTIIFFTFRKLNKPNIK